MSDVRTISATKIVLVTGLSGAGRSTAIRALEDLGYETIDNLPLSLLPNILTSQNRPSQIAVGLDARNRDFSVHGMLDMLHNLSEIPQIDYDLVFITCDNDVLVRRFSETRRRHPLAPAETPLRGIERERDLLVPIMARADIVINSSEMSPHDLRADIGRYFTTERSVGLAVSVQSFSYKRGLPRGVDMLFDCRFLNNPYWQPELRKLNGREKDIQDYVQADPRFRDFFAKISELSLLLLPAYTDEGKAHFSIGFGCTGGQHRSVALAELLAKELANQGWQVSIRHRELERNVA